MKSDVTGIILLAGNGSRLGASLPKQFLKLGKKPLFRHAYDRFIDSKLFSTIVLVCQAEFVNEVAAQCPEAIVVAGGRTRAESSYIGLKVSPAETEIVLIHDAARPFVSERILRENIEGADKYGAVNTCIPAVDTMLIEKDGVIDEMPERSRSFNGQTPQTFRYDLICKAHEQSNVHNATDDCRLVYEMGCKVHIVRGSLENFKITTSLDLKLANILLEGANDTEMASSISSVIKSSTV